MKNKKLNPIWVLVSMIFLFFSIEITNAQKSILRFGKISMEEMKMTSYEKDTNASAVILGEEGYSTYLLTDDKGWQLQTKIQRRIKILKQRGMEFADGIIYLYNSGMSKEEVSSLKGFTYNLVDGKIKKEKITSDAIFREEIDDFHTSEKFTFPDVKPGSVLEYQYVVTSDFLTPDPWLFQYETPVVESQYTIEIPEFLNFKEQSKGYERFQRSNSKMRRTFTYTYGAEINPNSPTGRTSGGIANYEVLVSILNYHAYDIPAFISEPYMNSLGNYLTSVEFELMSYTPKYGLHKNFSNTWEDVRKTLIEHDKFGMQLKNTGYLEDDAAKIIAESKSDLYKAMNTYDFIKSKMNWNNVTRMFVKDNLHSAYKDGIGNSSEINLLLVAMLRKVGLEAEPVILSTRKNGIIMPGQIGLNQFNYVVAGVKLFNKTVLLDATDKNCPFNVLPSRCLNGQGRIISENYTDWVDLNSTQSFESIVFFQADLTQEGNLTAKVSESHKGYSAYELRNSISKESSLDEYESKFEQSKKGIEISDLEINDKDSLQKPLVFNYNADLTQLLTVAGDMLYFNPMIFNKQESNPFKLENRKYPVDYIYPYNKKTVLYYTIPENYQVVELPKSVSYSMPEKTVVFNYVISQTGNKISLVCDLKINKPIFAYNEYPALRQFYENMVTKQAEQVVLKKIN